VIDLSNLNAPGWRRIVADLTAASGDERTFPNHLLAAMGQVAGARQAAMFMPSGAGSESGDQPTATLVWPEGPTDGTSADDSLGEPVIMRSSAASAFGTGDTAVFGMGADDGLYDNSHTNGFALAVPVGTVATGEGESRPAFVVVLLLDQRSRGAMQSTIAMVELLAGYAHLASTRSQLSKLRSAGAALDLATRLVASINSATGFKGSAMQLVNDLCRHLKADRVAIGWRDGLAGAAQGGDELVTERDSTPIKVVALSDTEHVDRRMAMVRKLSSAMDECLDQDQPVVFPIPELGEGVDPTLTQTVTHAHRELASSDANLKITSLPLRDGDEALGVITIESAQVGQSIDIRTVELLQATMDLVAPVLRLRKSDDRPIPARMMDEVRKAGAWAVGPKHTLWKLAGIAVMIAALLVTFVSVPYRVEADVELRPVERRIVAVPFEGIVSAVMPDAEAGQKVTKGQLLVKIDTSDLELSAVEARQSISQAESQAADAMRRGNGAEQQQAEAKVMQGQARLDLLNSRIESAEIRAPIDGTIIAGDLTERVGARLELGEPLFEIAPLDSMRLIAQVDDSDIGLVLKALESDGMIGSVATKAYPDRRFPLTVERVVPMAQAQDGKNSFLVYASLDESAGWMRPGMEGLAKLEVGDRTLLWIGSRRIVDKLRLWLWW
jgi:hypothetical protein